VADLGEFAPAAASEPLPPYWALFRRGQLRWTVIGISSYVFQSIAFQLTSTLLPKALVDQGAAVATSFGLASLVFGASIPGKAFTGYLMEIIGRRWTICYALLGSLPGLCFMLLAHRAAGGFAGPMMIAGALITGFTALSAGTRTDLPLGAVPDGAARARPHVQRVVRPPVFRRAVAIPDDTVYGLTVDFLRDAPRCRGYRRLYPGRFRPRDGRSARGRDRKRSRVCMSRYVCR
jgi:hypothetical protein